MFPNRGVGVYRGNRSESRHPGLLRLALRDRKWEFGETYTLNATLTRQGNITLRNL